MVRAAEELPGGGLDPEWGLAVPRMSWGGKVV